MDGADAYYGIRLSDRIVETNVGIICIGAVIARTGTQEYRFSDLPQDEAAELGIKGAPSDIVLVHRDAADVFDPEFIASLEGKPVTDGHPNALLTHDTVLDHQVGHMQNVRRGTQSLKSGDIPLLADLHITCKSLIAKIRSGLRQLSCGYTYHIALDGGRILQVDMTGNHVAVLRAGRAGYEARIYDQALTKEKPVKFTLKHIFGLGLKQLANTEDMTPEELAEAATAMDGMPRQRQRLSPRRIELVPERGTRTRGRAAQDADLEDDQDTYTAEEVQELLRRDRTRRAGRSGGRTAQDADEDDRRRAHSMLDRMYDARDKASQDEDEDLEDFKDELRALLVDDDSDDDEAQDGADAEDEETDETEEERRKKRKDAEAEDEELEESELIPVGDRPKDAIARDGRGRAGKDKRAAGMDGVDVLRALRKTVARSSDRNVRAAYDRALQQVRRGRPAQTQRVRGVRPEGSGYAGFAGAAGGRAAQDEDPGAPDDRTLSVGAQATAAYAKWHRKNPGEVKK